MSVLDPKGWEVSGAHSGKVGVCHCFLWSQTSEIVNLVASFCYPVSHPSRGPSPPAVRSRYSSVLPSSCPPPCPQKTVIFPGKTFLFLKRILVTENSISEDLE